MCFVLSYLIYITNIIKVLYCTVHFFGRDTLVLGPSSSSWSSFDRLSNIYKYSPVKNKIFRPATWTVSLLLYILSDFIVKDQILFSYKSCATFAASNSACFLDQLFILWSKFVFGLKCFNPVWLVCSRPVSGNDPVYLNTCKCTRERKVKIELKFQIKSTKFKLNKNWGSLVNFMTKTSHTVCV